MADLIDTYVRKNKLYTTISYDTRKIVPITGRASSLLEIFCMYDKRLPYQKQNRMEEETEPQT